LTDLLLQPLNIRAYTKVDANTLTYTLTKDGKKLGNGKVVIAADGKSRTVTETMPGAEGKPVTTTSVFDKQ
jgi:VCBS repeat-containing protein